MISLNIPIQPNFGAIALLSLKVISKKQVSIDIAGEIVTDKVTIPIKTTVSIL